MSLFGLRPPELLFVKEFHFRYFSFKKIGFPQLHSLFTDNLETSFEVDVRGYLIRLRPGGTKAFLEFLSENCQNIKTNYPHYQNILQGGTFNHLVDERTSEAKPWS